MIRYTKHLNVDYIVIDSVMLVDDSTMPVQIQINIQKVSEEERSKVFRIASVAFNRTLDFNKPKPQEKTFWWNKLFNR